MRECPYVPTTLPLCLLVRDRVVFPFTSRPIDINLTTTRIRFSTGI